MIEAGSKFRRIHHLRCKHQIVHIPRRKHLRERWLPWINWEAYYGVFVSLLAHWNTCFDAMSNRDSLSQLIHQQIKQSSKCTATARYSRSDATRVSVAWWLFSLCKFSVLHSPLFQILNFFVSHSNSKETCSTKLQRHMSRAFFSTERIKKSYIRVWLPCVWASEIRLRS